MGYNPQESLENTMYTMGTLLGVHSVVPWNSWLHPHIPRVPQAASVALLLSSVIEEYDCHHGPEPSHQHDAWAVYAVCSSWWEELRDGEIWGSWVMMCKSAYVIKHANAWRRIEETLELSSAICRGHGTKYQTCSRMKNMGVFVFFE